MLLSWPANVTERQTFCLKETDLGDLFALKGWYRLLDNQIKAYLFINNTTESENKIHKYVSKHAATAAFVMH